MPQDHDGVGVVCPACRIMLRLPGPDDELPPLVAPIAEPAPEEPEEDLVEEYEDDTEADEAQAAARSDRNFIAILGVVGVVLVGVFAWWMMPQEKAPAPVAGMPAQAPVQDEQATTKPKDSGTSAESAPTLLVEIETVAKAFLDAPTQEAALEHVLDPEKTRAKWDAWLSGEGYEKPGFSSFASTPITTGSGEGAVSVVAVSVADASLREIALVRRDGRLKVDWDSWAAWSEMTWDEIREKKPTAPVLFRVQLTAVDYYNFDFADEREWSSYRLASLDGMSSLYGYVQRGGALDQQLRPVDVGAVTRLALKVKYPPGAARADQVIIDSVEAEGWVLDPQAAGK
ncbi:hypothetical protein OKA04_21595 [Luteolibacter flavescens]|uniref:Uncharacterized protein n=1 Tax=Luteolibacter flavescens TaxID=1859460 RepID=A0ABT3FVU3_9BACT|nr:hypothetical protein [Luteolibacter flavescens]